MCQRAYVEILSTAAESLESTKESYSLNISTYMYAHC